MKENFLEQQEFWQALSALLSLSMAKSHREVLEQSQVSAENLAHAIGFLQAMNLDIATVEIENELWVRPPERWPKVRFEFSVLEWLAFQAHFPFLENLKNTPFFEILSGVLGQTERRQKDLDLFLGLERMSTTAGTPTLALVGENPEGMILNELERAILRHMPVTIHFSDESHGEQKFFPLRLCYFEGQLHVIGESEREHCLNCFPLTMIHSAIIQEQSPYIGPFSHLEVDQFLAGLHSMGGPEIRLVLKIKPGLTGPLSPPYHYLGAPYRVTNSDGEIIWAATVEPCGALFQWVASLHDKVEVLDPSSFREELKKYQSTKKMTGTR